MIIEKINFALFWLGKSEYVACFSEIWQHRRHRSRQSSRALLVGMVGASCAIAEVTVFLLRRVLLAPSLAHYTEFPVIF